MVSKLDKVLARKKAEDKAKKEIQRRKNISKKTKGKKRTRKAKNKGKKRKVKKVTTTQTKQPPIRLEGKGDKLEVNIVAKERRKKRKPKTFAEKRAEQIAQTGVADPSVLRAQQKISSEILGYSTQTKDPLTLRGRKGRYNIGGGVGGFSNVSGRYDAGLGKGIRTGDQSRAVKLDPAIAQIEILEEQLREKETSRRKRQPNMKRFKNRRGFDSTSDDTDDDDKGGKGGNRRKVNPRTPREKPPFQHSPPNTSESEEGYLQKRYGPPPRPRPPPKPPTPRPPTPAVSEISSSSGESVDIRRVLPPDFRDSLAVKPRRAEARPRTQPRAKPYRSKSIGLTVFQDEIPEENIAENVETDDELDDLTGGATTPPPRRRTIAPPNFQTVEQIDLPPPPLQIAFDPANAGFSEGPFGDNIQESGFPQFAEQLPNVPIQYDESGFATPVGTIEGLKQIEDTGEIGEAPERREEFDDEVGFKKPPPRAPRRGRGPAKKKAPEPEPEPEPIQGIAGAILSPSATLTPRAQRQVQNLNEDEKKELLKESSVVRNKLKKVFGTFSANELDLFVNAEDLEEYMETIGATAEQSELLRQYWRMRKNLGRTKKR